MRSEWETVTSYSNLARQSSFQAWVDGSGILTDYSDFTILIPTHERRAHLRQILDYYRDFEGRVLVGDSTDTAVPANELPENARYIHYPGMEFVAKMKRFVAEAGTTYAMLCADDDFITPGGISAALAFLKNNPDYESAQGRQVSFIRSDQVRFSPIYFHTIGFDLDAEKPSERLHAYMGHYVQQYYAVHHAETLKRAFAALSNFKNENFIELVVTCMCAIAGKHKVLPVFYSAREQRPGGLVHKRIFEVVNDPEYKEDLQKFSNAMIRELLIRESLSLEEALEVVGNALVDYVDFDRSWDAGAYSTLEDAKKRLVRQWKDRNPRITISDLNQTFDVLEKTGNPMHDEQANREVQRIAEIVARHSARPVAV